ncbi:MAG TPA: protein-disulfide reductase DsbD domain-containing protein [Gemmataceae bacterium]|jgi:DsbC/DsbD-like thiol-disulfide interchange protein|nr:protein-disulfide reductase DsbD domain-containing protein [Gemmataceae bacterium]
MKPILLALPLCLTFVVPTFADPGKDAIKKVEAVFEPAQAKPGQTVTVKIIVELADGYHTYPVVQQVPEAKFSVNSITFPASTSVVFVGDTIDPVGPKTKKTEDYEYLVYPGGGTWTRKAVVLPSAKAGATTAKVKLKLSVCDEDRCFPPKPYEFDVAIKVLDGPAEKVDPKYKAEVEKAEKK